MRGALLCQVLADCPVCGDPIISELPCPRCVELEKLFEAKRLAYEQRMRFLCGLPRKDVGVVELTLGDDRPADGQGTSDEMVFLLSVIISPFAFWGLWHFGRMAIAYLLKAGW